MKMTFEQVNKHIFHWLTKNHACSDRDIEMDWLAAKLAGVLVKMNKTQLHAVYMAMKAIKSAGTTDK